MIASLHGTVSDSFATHLIVECAGVGYGVTVKVTDHVNLAIGDKVKLYIREHIKEDGYDLYGFLTLGDKRLFDLLVSVKNVGPKVAMNVLDIGATEEVKTIIASGDIKKLQTAKGVGKRAAEQIVVELRERVGGLVVNVADSSTVTWPGADQTDEAVQTLMALGYNVQDASAALQNVDTSLPTEERVRQALKGTA